MVEFAPWWSLLVAPALLLSLALCAVAGDALLAAGEAGRPATASAALRPLLDVPRLLVAQPRRLPAADVLLWRLGVLVVPAAAVLSVLVVPFGHRVMAGRGGGGGWVEPQGGGSGGGRWGAGGGPHHCRLKQK
ncbi:NADH-quinone oxidoreductase subunit H, partial [Streptomyces sp. NPDC054802]